MNSEVMPNWLEKRAQLSPNRTALVTENETWTFAQLREQSINVARKLTTLGIKKGNHVAILMDNRKEFVSILHGIEYVGAVAVLLNTRLASFELEWQFNDSGSKRLIFDENYQDKVTNWVEQSGISLDNFMKINESEFFLQAECELKELHTIIYTSGTTGKPKGVMLSYGNHWWSAVGSSLNLGLHMDDCWLCTLPLFHVGGLSILLRSVIYGIPVILIEKFDPRKVNEAIEIHNVTIISVVSQMLGRMLADLESRNYPKSLRCVLLGGGPAPKPLLEDCKDKEIPVYQTYGMTETSSQIVTLSSEYMLLKQGSAGKPLFPAQLRIEKDGNIQPTNQAGEIVVKGPNVTQGYWNRQAESAKSLVNEWLYTGDIGYVDEDGFLFVLDRRSDLIISGGENIYPAEIEAVLLAHPAIEEVGVVGKVDVTWGQVPVAFVRTRGANSVTEKEIITFCSKRLAKYKVPVCVFFLEELPRNASNKLMRHKLKKLLDNDIIQHN